MARGELDVAEYLAMQKRYAEAVADATATAEADRMGLLGGEFATLEEVEDTTGELIRKGEAGVLDLLTGELARLEVEYALARAKGGGPKDSK